LQNFLELNKAFFLLIPDLTNGTSDDRVQGRSKPKSTLTTDSCIMRDANEKLLSPMCPGKLAPGICLRAAGSDLNSELKKAKHLPSSPDFLNTYF
jgi:hypothetical protein